MQPKTQGVIGEAKVLSKFIELGVPVSIPFGDNCSYDLIAEFGGRLNKIQVKSSVQTSDGKTIFTICKKRNNKTESIQKQYLKHEVDFYALYSIIRDKVYLVPFDKAPTAEMTIRYDFTKGVQNHFSNMEEDYLIENVLPPQ